MKKILKSKKRDKKIMITDVAISKVPLVRYKEIEDLFKAVKYFLKNCKDVGLVYQIGRR